MAVDKAVQDLGVREISYNRSPRIDVFNRTAGVPLASSYCMAAVYTWYQEAADSLDVRNPLTRTGAVWRQLKCARAYGSGVKVLRTKIYGNVSVLIGDIICWERHGKQDAGEVFLGHTGLAISDEGTTITTVEANTGPSSRVERDGDGVHRKPKRYKRTMLAIIRLLE